jgi:hypothetical protein
MEIRKIFRNQMEVRIDRVGTDKMRQKTLCSIGNSIGMLDGRKLLPVRTLTIPGLRDGVEFNQRGRRRSCREPYQQTNHAG